MDNTIFCSHLGKNAHQILNRNTSGKVSGITSRGVYLQPGSDFTIYLSQEKFKGPLTLNLDSDFSPTKQIQANSLVIFSPAEINFPQEKVRLLLHKQKTWQPPPAFGENKFIAERLSKIIHQIQQLKGNQDFFPLLELARSRIPAPIPGLPGLEDKLGPYFEALENGDLKSQALNLLSILGFGPGLTPLGDDFILGVLVLFNRWGDLLIPGENLEVFNQIILEKAAEKTTRISYSLLACAAEGITDERILIVLDSFFSDAALPEAAVDNLLSWGSSSGFAVLAGMIAVLVKCSPNKNFPGKSQ